MVISAIFHIFSNHWGSSLNYLLTGSRICLKPAWAELGTAQVQLVYYYYIFFELPENWAEQFLLTKPILKISSIRVKVLARRLPYILQNILLEDLVGHLPFALLVTRVKGSLEVEFLPLFPFLSSISTRDNEWLCSYISSYSCISFLFKLKLILQTRRCKCVGGWWWRGMVVMVFIHNFSPVITRTTTKRTLTKIFQ